MKIDIPAIDREIVARKGFKGFCEIALPELIDNYVHSYHIDVVANYCQEIIDNKRDRVVINLPPNSSKSTIISVLLPVYLWILDPTLKICSVSYTPSLAAKFSEESMNFINSAWFQSRWNITIESKSGKVAKNDYYTSKKGRRFSTSPGSRLTGDHYHYILCDDLNKAQDGKGAYEATNNWFKSTLPTRLISQKDKIIVVAQRLSKLDVSQTAIDLGYDTLILPMEFDKNNCDKRDWRKKQGEILSPRITSDDLYKLKKQLGEFSQTQLQQIPRNQSDIIFLDSSYRVVNNDELSRFLKFNLNIIISIDAAQYAKETSDYTSATILLWNLLDEILIWKEHHYKKNFNDNVIKIKDIYDNTKAEFENQEIKIIIENKSLGPALVEQLSQEIPVEEYSVPGKSKIERWESVQHIFLKNMIRFSNNFNKEYKDLLINFPAVKHDDSIDSLSQGLLYISRPKVKNFFTSYSNNKEDRKIKLGKIQRAWNIT